MHRVQASIFGPLSLALVTVALITGRAAGSPQAGDKATNSPSAVLKKVTTTGAVGFPGRHASNNEAGSERSLAPYFYVAGGDPDKDRLPLKETRAEVDIAGVIAAVKVHQVFENRGGKPIEAVYVFPASTRAAVHAMRMKIGARTVEARIERKQEARAQYEAAKRSGQRASLLEQNRPNVFTTSVANIMPGDRIEVELEYSEMIVPENATYELIYPTVVGPRYAGGADAKSDAWMANPHLSEGQPEPYAFDIRVHLQTGIPIKEISSPSHKVKIDHAGTSTADVRLDQPGGGNRDFVLRYRLAGDKIEAGLLLFDEPTAGLNRAGEKFFALLLEPPQRPTEADVPSREYIFLLDVSGSMHGFPLDTAKALMRELLGSLRPTDHFNVSLFSGASYVWSPSGSRLANPANIRAALDVIDKQSGGGGTELMGGLQAAYAIPAVGKGVSRTVVVVTDGFVGVEAQAFRFIRERLDQANLFAFGIGTSVNRGLIEGMARAGLGEPFVVLRPERAADEAEKLRHMIDRPVLTDIHVEMRHFEAYDLAPEKVPDLLAERPLLLFGKYRADHAGKIEISGRSGHGRFLHSIDLRPADARRENSALRSLWARKWVEILEDELHMGGNQEIENAITDLGLAYSLLTPFTSFVAVDSEVANRTGQVDTVRQALPMPEGVSNDAIGMPLMAEAAAEPAPEATKRMRPMIHRAPATDPLGVACKIVAETDNTEKVRDMTALVQLVERTAHSLACGTTAALRLRITVDGQGKITKVTRMSGDEKLAKALIKELTGKSSNAKALKGRSTVVLSIKMGTK